MYIDRNPASFQIEVKSRKETFCCVLFYLLVNLVLGSLLFNSRGIQLQTKTKLLHVMLVTNLLIARNTQIKVRTLSAVVSEDNV